MASWYHSEWEGTVRPEHTMCTTYTWGSYLSCTQLYFYLSHVLYKSIMWLMTLFLLKSLRHSPYIFCKMGHPHIRKYCELCIYYMRKALQTVAQYYCVKAQRAFCQSASWWGIPWSLDGGETLITVTITDISFLFLISHFLITCTFPYPLPECSRLIHSLLWRSNMFYDDTLFQSFVRSRGFYMIPDCSLDTDRVLYKLG